MGVKRLLLSLVAIGPLLASIFTEPDSVLACSPAPNSNAYADSELIIGGWLGPWRIAPQPAVPWPESNWSNQPIQIDVSVVDVFKGSAPSSVYFYDGHSLKTEEVSAGKFENRWSQPGECGFIEDPTGKYAIMGLTKDDEGQYRMVATFFLGLEPSGENYDGARGRLAALPLGGGSPRDIGGEVFPMIPAALAATLGPLAFLAGAACVWPGKAGIG